MAEALCRSRLGERNWTVSSAGFFADRPQPPAPEVEALLCQQQLDTSELTSQALDRAIVRQATHIFAMTEMHLTSLRKRFPKEGRGAKLVTEFSTFEAYRNRDVPDPMGGDAEDFLETYSLLEDAIPRIIAHVDATLA